MFGALKYTAKMLGLRKPRDAVDPQFTRPQGFHDPNDLDLNKLRRLIKRGNLAPCYPGRDAADDGETEARPLDADAATGGDGTSSGDVHFSPFSTNEDGQGPAWGRSLFEDAAEYGFGMARAVKQKRDILAGKVEEALFTPELELPPTLQENFVVLL